MTVAAAKPKTPKARTAKPDYQHVIGGFWGNHMRFFNTEPSADGAFRLWGHKPFDDFPRVGQIIKAEFKRSWVWLEITKVDQQSEPRDMYFLDAYPVFQEMKSAAVNAALPAKTEDEAEQKNNISNGGK